MLAAFALAAMAVVAARAGEAERAAMLFGAGDWQGGSGGSMIFGRRVIPWPMLPRLVDEAQASARRALGDQDFEAAMARGRALGPDRVVAGAAGRSPEADRLGAPGDAQPTRR